ncbi:MAG TPA: hypothetical protein VL251_10715 [Thermomonas sp.]|jgi:hypothetical protein|nr:hypothetical protein [Thermomonas sp.]
MSAVSRAIGRLSVTPLLYTIGLLVVLVGVLLLNLRIAHAQGDKAQAERAAAVTERDSWKLKVQDAHAANVAYGAYIDQLTAAAEAQQRQADAAAARAAQQVKAATAEADRAQRELADFRRRFNGKSTDCAAALLRLDAVCKIGSY